MRLTLTGVLSAACLMLAFATNASAAPGNNGANRDCRPPGPPLSAMTSNREWRAGAEEITEYLAGGGYRVTRCDEEGGISESQTLVPLLLPGGETSLVPIHKYKAGGPTISLTYGDPTDPNWVEKYKAAKPAIDREMLPPGRPVPPSQPEATEKSTTIASSRHRTRRNIIRISADTSCTDSSFAGLQFNLSWWGRAFSYRAKTTTMPAGDTTRSHITLGHHAWNNTVNGCGLGDQNNITMSYAGSTSTGVHTVTDGINAIDFGNMANVDCSGALACTYTFAGAGGQAIETDQRYDSSTSWSHSGQSGKYDVWSVASHETGHSIGLGHVGGSGHDFLTMYPYVQTGQIRMRDLARGDVLGMRAIYPPI